MGLREIKAKARSDLHREMRVRALYYPTGDVSETPLVRYVRQHSKFEALGDVKGTRYHFSERQEVVPEILFMTAEIEPARLAVVMLGLGEGYRIDNLKPVDFISQTAQVLELPEAEALTFEYPGSVAWPITMWS